MFGNLSQLVHAPMDAYFHHRRHREQGQQHRHQYTSSMVGVGLTAEAIEHNPIV
jgi:hypothetical protein